MIALSSGEAEYYGMVRGSPIALGARSLMEDMGMRMKVKVLSDSSAALGIARRRGLGKVRHIELNQLWLQEKVNAGDIEVRKVRGDENIADALTKHATKDQREMHMRMTGQDITPGRHRQAPDVK